MTSWCPLAFRRTSTAAANPGCLHCTLCHSRRCPKCQQKLRSAAGLQVQLPFTSTVWTLCCTWVDMLFAALASHFLQLFMVLHPVMLRLLVSCSSSESWSLSCRCACTKQPASCAGNISSWHHVCLQLQSHVMAACMWPVCSSASCCTRAAPPCSSSMQGFRRSQVPAIKDVKVGQLVSKSERCRVYRGTLQGKTAVIKVGRPTKTCLTAAPMGTTAPFTRERPCFCGCGPSRLPGKPAHAADH